MEQPIGPIFLTDPSVFGFRRVMYGKEARTLVLLPLKSGTTDFTVHDMSGKPITKYYVEVKGP